MYQAKRAGRGRHALYRAADDTATRRLELTGRLRAALIGAMLQLARELGLYVVAEGIETPEQLDHLRRAGASHGQGFHLARPMPATELTQLLQSCSGLGGAPS
jgi:EAL domain-containing protein (putative c-di-GMP-specific phosphodiesterase class I)